MLPTKSPAKMKYALTCFDHTELPSIGEEDNNTFDHIVLPTLHPDADSEIIPQKRKKDQGDIVQAFQSLAISSDSSVPADIDSDSTSSDSDSDEMTTQKIAVGRKKTPGPARNRRSASVLSDEDAKIQRPPGEAGKPGNGGYVLKDELKWPKKDYTAVGVSMRHFIDAETGY